MSGWLARFRDIDRVFKTEEKIFKVVFSEDKFRVLKIFPATTPPMRRITSWGRSIRFAALLRRAHEPRPLTEDLLVELQNAAISNPFDQASAQSKTGCNAKRPVPQA
ncbi:MAG: hypothetical protein Q8Q84_21680 [Hydrogenophaga sp.]|nr:hypothetical protein [Hydrogenophaga sp.]